MSESGPVAPAGWYPVDTGVQRYWDGERWTELVAPIQQQPRPAVPPQPAVPPSPFVEPPAEFLQPEAPISPPQAPYSPPQTPYSQPQAPYSQPQTPYSQQQAPYSQPQAPFSPSPDPWRNSYASPPASHKPYAPAPTGNPDPYAAVPVAMESTSSDRTGAALVHLSGIAAGFLVPLVVWAVNKDKGSFLADQSKEALNVQLSFLLYFFLAFISLFFIIGILFLAILTVMWLVMPIVAAIKASSGDLYRYPLTIRFVR